MKRLEVKYRKLVETLFGNAAEEYAIRYMDVDIYRELLNSCAALLREESSVLDLACGPGNLSQFFYELKKDCEIIGVDLSAEMLEIAKMNNPEGEFFKLDAMDLDKLSKKFNLIICGFLLPYLSAEEVMRLLAKCHESMESEALLYLSWMSSATDRNQIVYSSTDLEKKSGIRTFFHSSPTVENSLKVQGFEILIKRSFSSKMDGISDEVIIARAL